MDTVPKDGRYLVIKFSLREALEEIAPESLNTRGSMMSTPGIFVFITSIFKYYYFTSTRLACILVMRVESDSFWYTVKIVSLYQIRTYMHGKLHETKQCLIN